jgi:hypothetical protein
LLFCAKHGIIAAIVGSPKKTAALCLALLLAAAPLWAPSQYVHIRHAQDLLFGRDYVPDEAAQKKVDILREALYISIDSTAYNSRMRGALAILRDYGVADVPDGEGITCPGGPHHQRYTHRGWDFLYPSVDTTRRWNTRKALLLNTLDKVFVFSERERRKRESLGALLYYAHIIGDHWGDSASTAPDRMALSGSGATVITELEKHLAVLFAAEKTEPDYTALMGFLAANRGRSFRYNDEAEFAALQGFAWELLEALWAHCPALFSKEAFFTEAF